MLSPNIAHRVTTRVSVNSLQHYCLCLSLASTLGEAWGLGAGDCKNQRDFIFSTLSIAFFDRRDWIRGQSWIFDGPCILSESGELWLILMGDEW